MNEFIADQQINVSAQDILAALGFEAQRIVAAVAQHAAGYPFPSPKQIQEVIDRMVALNGTLLKYQPILDANKASASVESGLEVKLN